MEELEGNMELQRCLGCGKKFERRVALLSHSQTCQKRITVINKRRPSPPKLETDKRTGIQVRMYYEKSQPQMNKASDPSQSFPSPVSTPFPTNRTLPQPLIPSLPLKPPTLNLNTFVDNNAPSSPQLSDKDVTDVVSR